MEVKDFKEVFKPYCKRYSKEITERGLFKLTSRWIIIEKYLTDILIEHALIGLQSLGYFKTAWVNSFGIDIDDHDNGGWYGVHPTDMVIKKYTMVIQRLGFRPSVCVESPHGIHCYYFFDSHTSWLRLYETVREHLHGIDIEILPTPTKTLRIPRVGCFLNPETLESIDPPSPRDIKYYPAKILFISPEQASEETGKTRRSFDKFYQMQAKEAEHFPLENGNTNRAVVECGIAYRMAGLTLDQAAIRFKLRVDESTGYTGDLRDEKRIQHRFSAIYRHKMSYIPQPRVGYCYIVDEIVINKLVIISPFAKQRNIPLKHFLTELFIWCNYIENLKKDPVMYTYMCEKYPFFRKNTRAGYYPLPSVLLRGWNWDYFSILGWLLDVGFLKPLNSSDSVRGAYSNTLHSCKYYAITREEFPVIDI